MTPEEALKRIEKKHRRGCVCSIGGRPFLNKGEPCDMVKLARALDLAIRALWNVRSPLAAQEAERALREVAGEEASDG